MLLPGVQQQILILLCSVLYNHGRVFLCPHAQISAQSHILHDPKSLSPGGHQDMSMEGGLDAALLMSGLKQPLTSAGKGETFTPQNPPGLLWADL